MTWQFGDLVPLAYGAIMADPPWAYDNWSKAGERKNPKAHYACLSLDDIKALNVGLLAAPHCLLWLWATAPMLPQAIDVMQAWGFRYVTAGCWAKRSKTDSAWQFGTGYVLRSAMEPYLIGAIGSPKISSRSVRNLITAPVREHSRKPERAYQDFAELTQGQRRCDLFSREKRIGFESWGDEADRFTPQRASA